MADSTQLGESIIKAALDRYQDKGYKYSQDSDKRFSNAYADCSSLVFTALKNASVKMPPNGALHTRSLFNGTTLTSYAKENFDEVLTPKEARTLNGSLQSGDIITMNAGYQHVVIFSHYDKNGHPMAFGSQSSTGPAFIDLVNPYYWGKEKKVRILHILRAKPQSKSQTEDTTQDDTQPDQPSSPPPQSSSHSQTPLGARQDSKYKVISTSPSVNKTPRGKSTPPVPYGVQQDLSGANATMPDVLLNDKPAYVKSSNSTKVTGDSAGSAGGVKSGTVGGKSEPIEASPSVFINGQPIVRVGDMQHMQNKNKPNNNQKAA